MEIALFLKGLIIGFSIACPVGPIGVLCIQRTLAQGNMHGLITGMGAASADAIYGIIAAFGLTFISGFIVEQSFWFRVLGGLFLCYLGIKTFLSRPVDPAASGGRQGLLGAYSTTFLLTLTNPVTILSFAAIFAGLGLVSGSPRYGSATLMVTGVFMGSALWWLILSGSTNLLRERVDRTRLIWVNRFSGVVILTFGVLSLLSTL